GRAGRGHVDDCDFEGDGRVADHEGGRGVGGEGGGVLQNRGGEREAKGERHLRGRGPTQGRLRPTSWKRASAVVVPLLQSTLAEKLAGVAPSSCRRERRGTDQAREGGGWAVGDREAAGGSAKRKAQQGKSSPWSQTWR